MARPKAFEDGFNRPDSEVSAISLDGRLQLAAAVAAQAIQDLLDPDLLRATDALAWWLDDCGGPLWLDCLSDDYPGADPGRAFVSICGVISHAKKTKTKVGRYAAARN